MDLKKARNRCMSKAYAFARAGNARWAQVWIDRAAMHWPVGPQQLTHANRLLREAHDADTTT
jgi:hypothetical protein